MGQATSLPGGLSDDEGLLCGGGGGGGAPRNRSPTPTSYRLRLHEGQGTYLDSGYSRPKRPNQRPKRPESLIFTKVKGLSLNPLVYLTAVLQILSEHQIDFLQRHAKDNGHRQEGEREKILEMDGV